MPNNTEQPQVSEVTRQLIERDQAGRKKYGTTLDRDDLTLAEWLQHMAEELLDGAGYALAAKRELKKNEWTTQAPTKPGWYWWCDLGEEVRLGSTILHVFARPGHTYLCVEGRPYGPLAKRNFIPVGHLGGCWSTNPITPPDGVSN